MEISFVMLSTYFDIRGGNSKLTRKFMASNAGKVPVYGASTYADKVMGEVAHADFNEDALSFVRIGYAGHVALRKAPFSVTTNVYVLIPKAEMRQRIYLPYFALIVSEVLRKLAVGRLGKNGSQDYMQITSGIAMGAKVPIPLGVDGLPDLAAQQNFVKKHEFINRQKAELQVIANRLETLQLMMSTSKVKRAEFLIRDVFSIHLGKGKYTRKFARAHPGLYPLYTAATQGGQVEKIAVADFDTEAIHFTVQGAKAGTVFHREAHSFSMTADAGILIRKMEDVDYRYAFHALSEVFSLQNFRWGSNTASKYKVLDLKILLPILSNGHIDLVTQSRTAAEIDRKIASKLEITKKIRTLLETNVIINV